MSNNIKTILDRIGTLQDELETTLAAKAEKFRYSYIKKKVRFKADAIKWQKPFKTNLFRYVTSAGILTVVTAPVIYAVIVPLVFLDIAVTLYQAICFPVYGIKKVKRRDYIVIDRHHLAYLNLLQKLNCVYCGYGNGLMAYASEVTARTEAYWCPIKHAGRLAAYHKHYGQFSDYGDAEHFYEELEHNVLLVQGKEETPKTD